MKILVTGGAGFIASHVADADIAAGHDVAILDDLSRGSMSNVNPRARFYRGDVCDREFLERVFATEKPEAVNHHAAQMDVRRGAYIHRFYGKGWKERRLYRLVISSALGLETVTNTIVCAAGHRGFAASTPAEC